MKPRARTETLTVLAPDVLLSEAAFARELDALWPGLRLERAAEVDSTNTRLLERARDGDTRPRLLWALRQTAGRGRLGRPWWSDRTEAAQPLGPGSLTFSIGVQLAPPEASAWSGLSLAVGVALAESLGDTVRLKWPNDLWLQDTSESEGRKLGGVLIETVGTAADAPRTRHAVIGIGINLDAPAAAAGIEQPVAGWREIEPHATAGAVLARSAPAVLMALKAFEQAGFAAFRTRFAARDALAGRTVRSRSAHAVTGMAEGVDERGALLVRTASGLRLIESGEVEGEVRRADTPPELALASVRAC